MVGLLSLSYFWLSFQCELLMSLSAIFIRFNQVPGGVTGAGPLSIDFMASEALGPWGDLHRTIPSAKKLAYDRLIRLPHCCSDQR